MNLDNLRPLLFIPHLTIRHTAILLSIHSAHKKIRLKDLAKDFGMSPPAICRAWDKLSMLGLIRRIRDDSDHRNVYVILTENGLKLVNEITK